jgi:hypothetical protein
MQFDGIVAGKQKEKQYKKRRKSERNTACCDGQHVPTEASFETPSNPPITFVLSWIPGPTANRPNLFNHQEI